jgi:hypothetical protein
MTLKFKDWDQLNEASIIDKVKNWFSSKFGGPIAKIDDIVEEYRSAESDYVDEWEKLKGELDKLDLEKGQTKSDPAELKRIEKFIDKNNQALEAGEKAHAKRIDLIMKEVKQEINGDTKLRKYWEYNKTKVDAEVAEDMYNRAKNLADAVLGKSLYNKYKSTVIKAKEKDLEFRKLYGDLIGGTGRGKGNEPNSTVPGGGSTGLSDSQMEQFLNMSITDFSKSARTMDKGDIRELVSFLIRKRNDLYVQMDLERDALNELIAKKQGAGATKESAATKLKEIREKYMDKIRDLRGKITVVRR